MTTGAAPSHDHEPTPGPIDPPPGFTTCATPTLPVIVPEAFGDWDATQRAGYLARRHANAAEALTMGFAYTCLTTAGESDTERDPWHTAAAMIGAALGSSRHVAHRLITTAIELTERLPRTCALLVAGWIGLAAAHTIADETALVADEHIDALDTVIAAGLAPTRRRMHPPQSGPLRKMLTKMITACDPVAADARAEQARRNTDVEMTALRDDCAQVTAILTAEDALEVISRVDVLARTADADDPRTVGELRAAGLLALSRGWTCLPTPQGAHPSDTAAQPSARRIVLHAYTDSGPDGATGSLTLTGYGSVTNHTAAQLAAGATIRSHDLAHLADADTDAARRYRPSDAVALFCRGRDGTCVFPGCTTPAEKADLDHIIPFDHADPESGGHTTSDDLGCLCRTHHRLKTEGVWAYFRRSDGSYTWVHGPNHPTRDSATRLVTEPTGPLADHAPPVHPETSRRQQKAADNGRTCGNGSTTPRHRPHVRDRRNTEHRRLRDRARHRRTDTTQVVRPVGSPVPDEKPPF